MDATGETYSTAARKLGAVGDLAAADAVIIARVNGTSNCGTSASRTSSATGHVGQASRPTR